MKIQPDGLQEVHDQWYCNAQIMTIFQVYNGWYRLVSLSMSRGSQKYNGWPNMLPLSPTVARLLKNEGCPHESEVRPIVCWD